MRNWRNRLCCLLSGCFAVLSGAESYSDLMDRAEKLTVRRYDKTSRAFKIKSAELDAIFDTILATIKAMPIIKRIVNMTHST